jgi:hypothetical protein
MVNSIIIFINFNNFKLISKILKYENLNRKILMLDRAIKTQIIPRVTVREYPGIPDSVKRKNGKKRSPISSGFHLEVNEGLKSIGVILESEVDVGPFMLDIRIDRRQARNFS